MTTEAQNYIHLKNNLEQLSLHQMYANLDATIDAVQAGNIRFTDALLKLTELEIKAKEARIMQSCVKTANFPFIKTLEDFDFDFQPSINKEMIYGFKNLRFIENAENLIFIGSSGVGKTHISTSLGIEAAKNRKSAYFINCNDLLLNLKRAHLENRLEERLKHYAKYKLLIIDEVGFIPIDDESTKLFLQLISKRYEKHSTIITTNIELSEWGGVFGDPVCTNAILDRLLHHSHVIKIIGNSYRTRDYLEEVSKERAGKKNEGNQ